MFSDAAPLRQGSGVVLVLVTAVLAVLVTCCVRMSVG